jgi:inorganic pyrophosphatase
MRSRVKALPLFLLPCLSVPTRAIVGGAPVAPDAIAVDAETVRGLQRFDRLPTDNPDGSLNAIVEIPAGTTAKFEVGDDGVMRWEHAREGGRREVDYLPYPVNYGMVPCTLAADGDALDVVVLGRTIERGRVAHTRVIGVLEMADRENTRDDKVIAVPIDDDLENGFSRLHDIAELDGAYANSRTQLFLWFSSYWGLGNTRVIGWGDAREAAAIVEASKACSAGRAGAARRRRARSPSAARAR